MVLRLIAALLLLAGCSSTTVPQEARAVRDFVAVSELERVESIRLYRPLRYGYVNDYFVIVIVGERHYLLEFTARCRALRAKTFTAAMVDHRYDPSFLHARDTIRGCPVGKIYKASPKQLVEAKELSKSVAAGQVLPEDV